MRTFNVLTIDSATQAGGQKRAEKVARSIISDLMLTTILPGFEFKSENGQVTVVTSELKLAQHIAKHRLLIKNTLMHLFRHRQVRGFYVNQIGEAYV